MTARVLDTHVWFWYLTGSNRLPPGFRSLIDEEMADCFLSPISVWEAGLLVARGRIELDRPFNDWCRHAFIEFPVNQAPLTLSIAQMSIELDLPHPDPADRFIAATALALDAELMTVDRRLVDSPLLRTVPL